VTAPDVRILVAHASAGSEGQTVRIAERLAETLVAAGAEVQLVDLERDAAPPLAGFDGALIGGSVRGGRYRRPLRRLLHEGHEQLAGLPWAFFSVCLTIAATDERARGNARELPRRLMADAGLAPLEIAVFGGALRFSHHGRLGGRLLFAINRRYLPEASMDRDWEYTDWAEVEALAHRLMAVVRYRTPTGPG
jgi:menaquinone-dependent protoporphyrinogen oxidase